MRVSKILVLVVAVAILAGCLDDGSDVEGEAPGSPTSEPYREEGEWHGHITCGGATPIISFNLCAGIVGDPPSVLDVAFDEGLKTLVIAMDWQPSDPVAGNAFSLTLVGAGSNLAVASGPPPLEIRLDGEDLGTVGGLQLRVFPDGEPVGVTIDQSFVVHHHAFYHEAAPPDHRALP